MGILREPARTAAYISGGHACKLGMKELCSWHVVLTSLSDEALLSI
jgi:hypothetical protein